MVRSAAVLALAFALGTAGCMRARGTQEEPVVVGFEIEGVHAVSEDALVEKLATQASGRFAWDQAWRLDPDALAADRRRVEAFYREHGYYQARVVDVAVIPAGSGRAKIKMVVQEGPPIRVAKLTVNGLDAAPEAQQHLGQLPLKPGGVFTEGAYDQTRDAILGALRSTGWATAEVAQKATVLPEASAAEVIYDVEPGRRWRFGPIFPAGTVTLPRDRIREQVLGALKPGDWFDDARLADAQKRVFALGVFGAVRVTRGQPDPASGTIPIVVAVREAPFRTLRLGPQLAFEVIRWDANATFSWQHRNFFGEMRKLGTDARLGFAWLPNPLTPTKEGTVGLFGVEFSQPGALTRYVDTSVRVEAEKGIEQAYNFYAQRFRLGLPLRLVSRWALVPSYNLEVYEVSDYGIQFNPGSPVGAPMSGVALVNCKGNICLLTYLEQKIAWDGRDNPVETHRGLYVGLSLQEAFHLGPYGFQYFRFFPEMRAFWPLGPRTVVAVRARLGGLVPIREVGDPPIVARFEAGGPLSMRGYYTRRLAKMVLQNNEWVPFGGNGLADGSVELRFGLSGNLGAAVFLDGASVSDASAVPNTWKAVLDPARVQLAAGFALRYLTPFGPIRLDIGVRLPDRFPITSIESYPPVPYTFYPDGTPHREPILAVYLSLGESF